MAAYDVSFSIGDGPRNLGRTKKCGLRGLDGGGIGGLVFEAREHGVGVRGDGRFARVVGLDSLTRVWIERARGFD